MKARLQSIPPPSDTSLTVFELSPGDFGCPFHFHPEVELVFISEGRGLRLIGDHLAHFEAGDFCLIGADLPHFHYREPLPHRELAALASLSPSAFSRQFKAASG